MELLLLNRQSLQELLPMEKVIPAVAAAYRQVSQGKARLPQRLNLPANGGDFLIMPGYLVESDALAVKLVSVFSGNAAKHLPTIHALVILVEADSGRPLALMEGGFLTAVRTGAASGVATRYLARPEASILAIFGAGGQSEQQIRAVLAVRPLREVRIFDLRPDAAPKLVDRMASQFPAVCFVAAQTPAQAVAGADVITTVTTSTRPVFPAVAVKPGAHINGIGAYTPAMCEIDLPGLSDARVFVDSVSAALAEAGDLIQAAAAGATDQSLWTEIGAVVAGISPGRRSPTEITFFKSVGVAAQDVVTAQLAYQGALAEGKGEVFRL